MNKASRFARMLARLTCASLSVWRAADAYGRHARRAKRASVAQSPSGARVDSLPDQQVADDEPEPRRSLIGVAGLSAVSRAAAALKHIAIPLHLRHRQRAPLRAGGHPLRRRTLGLSVCSVIFQRPSELAPVRWQTTIPARKQDNRVRPVGGTAGLPFKVSTSRARAFRARQLAGGLSNGKYGISD